MLFVLKSAGVLINVACLRNVLYWLPEAEATAATGASAFVPHPFRQTAACPVPMCNRLGAKRNGSESQFSAAQAPCWDLRVLQHGDGSDCKTWGHVRR